MRTGCSGKYLDLRGQKWQEAGDNYIMRSFITCMLHQIKEDERSRNVACMGKMRNSYRILVGDPEGKRPLGKPRHRW